MVHGMITAMHFTTSHRDEGKDTNIKNENCKHGAQRGHSIVPLMRLETLELLTSVMKLKVLMTMRHSGSCN